VDATQLFLCAFVVTMPTAITIRMSYEAKRKALEGEMEEVMKLLSEMEEAGEREGK